MNHLKDAKTIDTRSSTARPSGLGRAFGFVLTVMIIVFSSLHKSVAADAGDPGVEITNCSVHFAREINVPALQSGPVSEIAVDRGDTIAADATILRLDQTALVFRRDVARTRFEQTRDLARSDVDKNLAAVVLEEAEAELAAASSAGRSFGGGLRPDQIRQMRLAIKRAEAEVRQAEVLSVRAASDVALRKAELDMIEHQLSNLNIRSPILGVVMEIHKHLGEWVDTGQTIATIAQTDTLHVYGLADCRTLPRQRCQSAAVTVHWSDPSTGKTLQLPGKVVSVDPLLLSGDQYRFRVEVRNQLIAGSVDTWMLVPGVNVQMRVTPRKRVAVAPVNWKNR